MVDDLTRNRPTITLPQRATAAKTQPTGVLAIVYPRELARRVELKRGELVFGDDSADDDDQTAPIKRPAPQSAEELAEVLERFDGSVRATARWYGRHRRQIYRWIEALGLERGDA